VIIRCTSRVSQPLKLSRLSDVSIGRDDWYVNIVTVDRRRVVLAMHAETLFPVLAVSTSARDLPSWLAERVQSALTEEGLPPHQLGSLEVAHAVLARTASRKVLGHLKQVAFELEHIVLSEGGWDRVDLAELERGLRRSLRSRDGGHIVPLELAAARRPDPAEDALLAEFQAGLVGLDAEELRSIAGSLLELAGSANQGSSSTAEVDTLLLSASIDEAVPPITRTLSVPASLDLESLHRLLQRAFGWDDCHLFRFARGCSVWDDDGELYLCDFDVQDGETRGTPARRARLAQLLRTPGESLTYLYDYGDNWQLTLTLEELSSRPAGAARVTGGAGASPPEDSGGIHAWNDERPDPQERSSVRARTYTLRQLARRRGAYGR
jgi:hypothetical protein